MLAFSNLKLILFLGSLDLTLTPFLKDSASYQALGKREHIYY